MLRIGIDLGGTKTEGIVMDANGQILLRERRTTPQAAGYAAILDNIAALVATLESRANATCRVGIGTPGAIASLNVSNAAAVALHLAAMRRRAAGQR